MPGPGREPITSSRVISHMLVLVAAGAVMGILVALLVLPFAGVAGLATRDVANNVDKLPTELTTDPLAQRTRVLATDGTLIATWYDQNRVNVRLNQVAKIMQKSILSIEDSRFYEHGALDLRGTLRAFVTNQANNGTVQGGSSITQQMVKMTLLEQAKTKAARKAATADSYQRKFNELRYAIAFEQKYPKQWILERYLNLAYFGDGAYGIEAAARHYFSVPAKKLTLTQATLLAGVVKNPTKYDPTNSPDDAIDRRDVVINRMEQLGVISAKRAAQARKHDLGLHLSSARNGCVSAMDGKASWFCDYLREYLLADPQIGDTRREREHLLDSGGLTIHTTLDPRFQIAADNAVAAHVHPTDRAIGGLAMVVPGTGEVRALAQSRPMGRDSNKGQTFLNYVVPREFGDSGGFQAGSTFKVFVLAAAITDHMPLSTTIYSPQSYTVAGSTLNDCDKHGGFQDWHVENSTGFGTFNMYSGTQDSVNTFFAQLEQRTGLCDPITLAKKMGVTVPDRDRVGPFTLGVTYVNPLTMSSVYATFAARGVYCEPRPVTQITDSVGDVVADYPDTCTQLVRSDVADAINDILRGVMAPGGFGAALNPGQPSAGKTGTRSSNISVWFDGYTPDLAAAAMIAGANRDGHEITLNGQTVGGRYISTAHGSTEAGPIWGDAMKAVAPYLPDTNFVPPSGTTIAGRLVTVPSVYGLSPHAAAKVLRKAGFVPSIGSFVNSAYSQGTVAYLNVRSGSQLATGRPITIFVSNGILPHKQHKP